MLTRSRQISFFFGSALIGIMTCTTFGEVSEKPSISVTGTGEIKVVPNRITVTLGIVTQDMSLEKSKAENDNRVKKLLALTRELEIDPKDVQTAYVTISPEYDREDHKSVFKGYEVTSNVSITIHDAKKYDEVLSKSLALGVNNVNGVEFHTTQLRKHRDEARRLALIAAREKALAMAEVLGQTIGRPLDIVEQSASSSLWNLSNQTRAYGDDGENEDVQDDGTIALGRISISASVRVRFELIDKP